jgi:glyoxylase-like metal-dependent hydrolase (beta-lactamase superfamily II)
MNIEMISVGPFEVNCAIVWGETKQALVIDPGHDAARIETALKRNGLAVTAYLLTHGHADHLCALADLHATRPAPIYIHAEDYKWAFGQQNQIPPYYSVPIKPSTEFIHPENPPRPSLCSGHPSAEGALLKSAPPEGCPQGGVGLITLADLSFQTLETPGHTKGCVCYYFEQEKIIFTGDTLFKGTCGRTDLPGGDGRILAQSLKKLAALPDDVTVHAGHNESTTIGCEKRTNFFMQQAAK